MSKRKKDDEETEENEEMYPKPSKYPYPEEESALGKELKGYLERKRYVGRSKSTKSRKYRGK